MMYETMEQIVIGTCFGAILGWYIYLIGSGVKALIRWIKEKRKKKA